MPRNDWSKRISSKLLQELFQQQTSLGPKKKHQFHRQTFLNIRNVARFYLEGFKGDK